MKVASHITSWENRKAVVITHSMPSFLCAVCFVPPYCLVRFVKQCKDYDLVSKELVLPIAPHPIVSHMVNQVSPDESLGKCPGTVDVPTPQGIK